MCCSSILTPKSLEGTFGELVELLDERARRRAWWALRRSRPMATCSRRSVAFPRASTRARRGARLRALADPPGWAGERVLDIEAYEREIECDWTSGSFMLARREALLSAGCSTSASSSTPRSPTSACASSTPAGGPCTSRDDDHPSCAARAACAADDRPGSLCAPQYAQKHFAKPHQALISGAIGTRHLIRAATAGNGTEAAVHGGCATRDHHAFWARRAAVQRAFSHGAPADGGESCNPARGGKSGEQSPARRLRLR